MPAWLFRSTLGIASAILIVAILCLIGSALALMALLRRYRSLSRVVDSHGAQLSELVGAMAACQHEIVALRGLLANIAGVLAPAKVTTVRTGADPEDSARGEIESLIAGLEDGAQ